MTGDGGIVWVLCYVEENSTHYHATTGVYATKAQAKEAATNSEHGVGESWGSSGAVEALTAATRTHADCIWHIRPVRVGAPLETF